MSEAPRAVEEAASECPSSRLELATAAVLDWETSEHLGWQGGRCWRSWAGPVVE